MNFKLNIILLLIILNGGSLTALPINIIGSLSNNGVPAQFEKIYIRATGADTSAISDSQGMFNFFVNPTDSMGQMRIFFLDCLSDTLDTIVFYDQNTRIVPVNLNGCNSAPINKYSGVVKLNSTPIFGPNAIMLRYKYEPQAQKFSFNDTVPIASNGKFEFSKDSTSDYLIKVIPKLDTTEFAGTYYPSGIIWDDINSKAVGPHLTSPFVIDLKPYTKPSGTSSAFGKVDIDTSLKSPGYSGVGLHLLDLNNNPIEFVYANDSGNFHFQNLDTGEYKIWIDQCGLPTTPTLISITGPNTHLTEIRITGNENGISSDDFVGFSELPEQIEVSFYPNPFGDYVNLEISESASIHIHDISGRIIFNTESELNEKLKLDTDSWRSGIYIITIKTKEDLIQRKLIKR